MKCSFCPNAKPLYSDNRLEMATHIITNHYAELGKGDSWLTALPCCSGCREGGRGVTHQNFSREHVNGYG